MIIHVKNKPIVIVNFGYRLTISLMNKLLSLLATAALATGTVLADNYTPWGYYLGNMEENLGLIGAGSATLRVAIFVPGDGILNAGTIAGVNVPVYDASAVTELSAWVATSLPSGTNYDRQVALTSYSNGYNQALFAEPYTVTESGCYVGYTITVNTSLNTQGSQYPAIYDLSTQVPNSFWIWFNAQYDWQDIGTQYGASCVQALFSELKLPETAARFGTVRNAFTGMSSETEFPVTVYSDASEAVSNIEYTIDVDGVSETRTADVAIPAGFNQSGEVKVKVNSPAEAGSYDVALTITKVNGKDNTLASQTSVTTFNNLLRIVERNTLVEEFTGTGCPWCPRGMQGMANLRAEFGSRFIGLAFHSYNSSDPMYPNYYISARSLGITGAPGCIIDRKEVMDPYFGTQQNSRYVLQDFEDYCSLPAEVNITLQSEWTGANSDSVQINVNVEALGDGNYEVVYALVADSLTGTANVWRQANNYSGYTASQAGGADLAKFCRGGQYGSNYFFWTYDDVVIASSYNNQSINQASPIGRLSAGEAATGSYLLGLPQKAVLRAAVDASIDKVYAVAFVLNADGTVAQAVKAPISKSSGQGIEQITADGVKPFAPAYDLQGRQLQAPRHGQLFIRDGRKMIMR